MTFALLQPVLPWSGAQEEDRRFRRILLAVLTIASVLSAILPQLPMPWVEADPGVDQPPAVVRMIAQPITLFSPPQAATQPAATERPVAAVPEPQASVAEQPQTAESVTHPDAPPAAAETVRQKTQQEAKPARAIRGDAPPQRRVDKAEAARAKAAKSGVLAMRDSLAALRAFTPATPVTGARTGPAVSERAAQNDQPSLLSEGVASGSGGIDDGVPGPRALLGERGLQDRIGGAGGLAALQGSSAAGGTAATPFGRGKTRSEEEIQEVLDRHKSAIYTLYNRELRLDPSLQGKVVVSITIAPSGKVTDCGIEYSELKSDTLKEKLIRLIKGVDFGAKADVPSVTTKVPIEFFPV